MKVKTREGLCVAGMIVGAFLMIIAGGGWERELATLKQVAPLMIIGFTVCCASALIGGACE